MLGVAKSTRRACPGVRAGQSPANSRTATAAVGNLMAGGGGVSSSAARPARLSARLAARSEMAGLCPMSSAARYRLGSSWAR